MVGNTRLSLRAAVFGRIIAPITNSSRTAQRFAPKKIARWSVALALTATLLIAVACGPSEAEIARTVDAAVTAAVSESEARTAEDIAALGERIAAGSSERQRLATDLAALAESLDERVTAESFDARIDSIEEEAIDAAELSGARAVETAMFDQLQVNYLLAESICTADFWQNTLRSMIIRIIEYLEVEDERALGRADLQTLNDIHEYLFYGIEMIPGEYRNVSLLCYYTENGVLRLDGMPE